MRVAPSLFQRAWEAGLRTVARIRRAMASSYSQETLRTTVSVSIALGRVVEPSAV